MLKLLGSRFRTPNAPPDVASGGERRGLVGHQRRHLVDELRRRVGRVLAASPMIVTKDGAVGRDLQRGKLERKAMLHRCGLVAPVIGRPRHDDALDPFQNLFLFGGCPKVEIIG